MEVAVVDVETTSLRVLRGSIVEIGIIGLDLAKGDLTVLFDHVVRETRFSSKDMNAWIFLHSTLTYDFVSTASPLQIHRVALQSIFNRYALTSYNREFDIAFLHRAGFTFPRLIPCIMHAAAGVLKLGRFNGKYTYPSLGEAWHFFFQIPLTNAHRATADAWAACLILLEMYRRGLYRLPR